MSWFKSFLQGKPQLVLIGCETSSLGPLARGVSHGSVLSPPLFNICWVTSSITMGWEMINMLMILNSTYLNTVTLVKLSLPSCNAWRLKGSGRGTWNHSRSKCLSSLVLDGVLLSLSEPVHNLGVLLDSCLLLEDQVVGVNKRAFAQLRFVHQLQPFLDHNSICSVTQALAYCLIWQCTLHGPIFEIYLEALVEQQEQSLGHKDGPHYTSSLWVLDEPPCPTRTSPSYLCQ